MVFLNKLSRHAEWRKIAKKARRKRIRQARAKERDQRMLEDQQKLEKTPGYQKWLEQQELLQREKEVEEQRQAAKREEEWLRVEVESQKQWRELQAKIAQAREEKIKQNMKIKLEWEREQKRLKEIQEVKEKELEENRLVLLQREKELLDFLEQGGDTPEHLNTTMETNPGKELCPFFHKVSACRFFDGCSRNHVRPGISRTILISNFFSDISLETKENEHGSDSNLEFEKEEITKHYKEFFYDVVSELETCGKIRNFRTCCNHELHLRGNVYVQYYSTREALVCYHKFNGRWYAGKQLNVQFCGIESWKNAICGLFHRNRCPKGNACNFLHVFKNPRNLYSAMENDSERISSSRRNKGSHRKRTEDENSWDREPSEKRNWRWSESPEHIREEVSEKETHRENGRHSSSSSSSKKRSRESKERNIESSRRSKRKRTSRSRSRSRSPKKKTSRRRSRHKESSSSRSGRRKSKSRISRSRSETPIKAGSPASLKISQ